MKPEIFDSNIDRDKIEKLKIDKNIKLVDFYNSQIEELGKVKKNVNVSEVNSVWVYYPWSKLLVHTLNQQDFRLLRLSRNKNLINEEEQKKFSDQVIGITGLNVGNSGALCIVLEGGANKMKFADNDVLELSNFNRFRGSLSDLGVNKALLSAQQAYEIDPFYDIEVFDNGINNENIDTFLNEPKIDLLIEEMDNLQLKVKIREKARYFKIPVLMVTGNGPGLIIDIERFDLEPKIDLLNGYLKENIINKITKVSSKTSMQEKVNLARDFMGKEFLTERLNQSFDLVGKTLAGIPQISESSFLRGAALSYFARQIAIGNKVQSGRYALDLNSFKSIKVI